MRCPAVCRSIIAVIVALVLAQGVDLANAAEEKDVVRAYGVEVSAGAGVAVRVWVNGVPFAPKEAGSTGVISLPIHGEVMPGQNRIDVQIGTADVPPGAAEAVLLPSEPADASVTVRLQEDLTTEPTPGTYETRVEDLHVGVWEPERTDDGVPFPQVMAITFTAPDTQPVPIWSTAEKRPVADLQATLERAHIVLIERLRSGEADAVGLMSRRAYEDAAAAYPLGGSPERRRESDVMELRSIASDPEVTIPDMEGPLTCEAYAGGRLFECFAADGEPPVRALFPGEEPIYFTFRFSVLDGDLAIVR